ncbi:MAG: hypothetical protein Tsb0014_40550 [Pleurocapsa sp.]
MKSRSFFLTLVAGAIAMFLVAVGGLFWIVAQSPLTLLGGGVDVYPQATVFIPKQAPAVVSLLVNPEKLEALRQLKIPLQERRRSRQEWNELKTNLLAKTGLDYQKDIKPWLGEEITLAVTSLDYDRNASNGVQPGYLLATATKNTQLAKEFLQISFSEQAIASDIDLVFEQYKGVGIIYQRSLKTTVNPSIWASAVVGDFVLFSNHPQVLKEAINNAQAVDLNLEQASYYKSALDTIIEPRIGLAYVNLPGASAWLDKAPIPEAPDVEQTLTVTLSVKQAGLIAETALIGINGASDRTPSLTEPIPALSYLPPKNIVTVAGEDLAGFWQKITTGVNPKSPLAQLVNQLVTSIETPLGINLAEDIFSWVKGEYALSLVSQPEQKNFGWLFVAATPANESEIETAIARLDTVAQQQGLTVSDFNVNGTNITAWTKLKTSSQPNSVSLNADVKGAHTRTEEYIFLASSLEAIATALNHQESWLSNPEFQRITTTLPEVNDGYVYVNFADGKPILEQKVPIVKVIELAGQSLFSHLRAIALTSQGSQSGVRRATILFNFDA